MRFKTFVVSFRKPTNKLKEVKIWTKLLIEIQFLHETNVLNNLIEIELYA